MLVLLISFLIFLLVVVGIGLLILWAVRQFLPEAYQPARLVVGVIVLVVLLVALLSVVQGTPIWSGIAS